MAGAGSSFQEEAVAGITGLLIDIDGTLHEAGVAVEGAGDAIARLRGRMPVLFTTNTSRMPRRRVAEELAGMGIPVAEGEIFTATVAAANWLRQEGIDHVQLLTAPAVREDFSRLQILDDAAEGASGRSAEAVVVADMGSGFTFEVLNSAFRSLLQGAHLVAIHRNRYWLTEEGPTLDAGPFVAALEYGAQTKAVLVGKPATAFFDEAASLLGVERSGLVVVGDDPETDIAGALGAGLRAIQVGTGKSRGLSGERMIGSIAELPSAFAGGKE